MTETRPPTDSHESPVVVIDGKRYVPADEPPGLLDEPDLPGYEKWIPAVGDTVWSNFDSGPPMGVCVGYLNHPGNPRHGQPVIEWQADDETGFFARKRGDRRVCHPMFMWPFEPGSAEHHEAIENSRFRP